MVGCASQNHKDLSGYSLIAPIDYDNPLPGISSEDEYGVIVVRRDSGFTGSALRARLYLDGLSIANLRPGEYVELKLSPGEYDLTLNSNGFAFVPVETKARAKVSLGSKEFYRVQPVYARGMRIMPLDETAK